MLATLLTGLYSSTPAGFVGASWYGFPFTWIRMLVVAPEYNPWSVDVQGLACDLVVWVAAFAVVGYALMRLRGGTKAEAPKPA